MAFPEIVFYGCKLAPFENGGTKHNNFKHLLKLDTFFGSTFLATFMDFYLIYFVVVPQGIVFLVLEPLGADFELPS